MSVPGTIYKSLKETQAHPTLVKTWSNMPEETGDRTTPNLMVIPQYFLSIMFYP